MPQKRPLLASLAFATLATLSCSGSKDEDTDVGAENINASPNDAEQGTGCIQGVVVNGLTHERVVLGKDVADRIYLVTPGRIIGASVNKTAGNNVTRNQLEGEFFICGVPVENDFPLYVKLAGHQEFFTLVPGIDVPPIRTLPLPGAGSSITKFWSTPVKQVNLRVFPTNEIVGDYKVRVHYRGAPVQGATVRLVPKVSGAPAATSTTPSSGASDGEFASASDLRMQALSAVTNSSGEASFPASSMVFGGKYALYAFHPDLATANGQNVEGRFNTDILVGIANGTTEPFSAAIHFSDNLTTAANALSLVSQSNVTTSGRFVPNADGKLSLVFNRAVAQRQGNSASLYTATVTTYGTRADNTDCNGGAYTFGVASVNAAFTQGFNVVQFSPTWDDEAAFAQAKTECKGMKIRYTIPRDAIRAESLLDMPWGNGAGNELFEVLVTDE